MREIEFRGKRVDNGEWVEGWLVKDAEGACFIACTSNSSPPISAWKVKSLSGSHDMVILGACEIIPETVGQYTGLKDKTGKKIYEGSEISYLGLGSIFTGKVMWCEANLTWVVNAVDGDGLRQRPFLVHIKNPELMEQK